MGDFYKYPWKIEGLLLSYMTTIFMIFPSDRTHNRPIFIMVSSPRGIPPLFTFLARENLFSLSDNFVISGDSTGRRITPTRGIKRLTSGTLKNYLVGATDL